MSLVFQKTASGKLITNILNLPGTFIRLNKTCFKRSNSLKCSYSLSKIVLNTQSLDLEDFKPGDFHDCVCVFLAN